MKYTSKLILNWEEYYFAEWTPAPEEEEEEEPGE